MASAAIPAPGTKFGPCENDCPHEDCAASRGDAAQICAGCGLEIGYERHWWRVAGQPQHYSCTMDALDAQRAEGKGR